MENLKKDAVRDDLLDRVKRAGAEGVVLLELGYTGTTLYETARKMVVAGEVFRGQLGRRTVRFFSSQEFATAFEINRRASPPEGHRRGYRAPWPADAPIHYPVDANGKPTYKHTIAPVSEAPGGRIPAFWVNNRLGYL